MECVTEDSALWRAEAWVAYAQVENELHCAAAKGSRKGQAFQTVVAVVRDDLDDALTTLAPPPAIKPREGEAPIRRWWHRLARALKQYYSGGDISRSWSAVYRAGGSLFAVYDEAELYAQATRLEGLITALPDSKAQGKVINDAREKLGPPKGEGQDGGAKTSAAKKNEARALLRQVYRDAIGVTESLQAEARMLRNTLLIASGALLTIILVVGIVNLLNADVFSLCADVGESKKVCPIGTEPHRLDVFVVAIAGMLGGVLSVVIPLSTGERIKTPFRVFNHQLLLKVVAGAGTALAGILLVVSAFTSAIAVNNEAMIIGYAVFFGFSQQAVTGILDRKVSKLGEETPTTKSV